MHRITVDDSFTKQMSDSQVPSLVFDAAGNQLGCFTPDVDPSWYLSVEPSVSEEELARRELAGGGRSLAEILADLQQRR